MNHAPVLAQWRSYLKHVVPAGASATQIEETRRGFYAGAYAMFALVMEATKPDDEALCEQNLSALEAETAGIVQDLRTAIDGKQKLARSR